MDGLAELRGKCAPVLPFLRQQLFLLPPSDTPSVLNLRTIDQRGTWHSLRLCSNGTYPNASKAFTISRGPDEKKARTSHSRRQLLLTHPPSSCFGGWRTTFVSNP